MEAKAIKTGIKTLYVGIDVHKRQWSVSIFSEHLHLVTFSQKPEPEVLQV